eukprot:2843023-Pyramimonas_sp.AAC.1
MFGTSQEPSNMVLGKKGVCIAPRFRVFSFFPLPSLQAKIGDRLKYWDKDIPNEQISLVECRIRILGQLFPCYIRLVPVVRRLLPSLPDWWG